MAHEAKPVLGHMPQRALRLANYLARGFARGFRPVGRVSAGRRTYRLSLATDGPGILPPVDATGRPVA